jgi:hypothetical protein
MVNVAKAALRASLSSFFAFAIGLNSLSVCIYDPAQ